MIVFHLHFTSCLAAAQTVAIIVILKIVQKKEKEGRQSSFSKHGAMKDTIKS